MQRAAWMVLSPMNSRNRNYTASGMPRPRPAPLQGSVCILSRHAALWRPCNMALPKIRRSPLASAATGLHLLNKGAPFGMWPRP